MSRLVQNVSGCWLTKALSSTIGRKVLMAITGLGLCGFLVVHLGGNLLLYAGAESYNHYAETLHAQKIFLRVAEVGLALLFIVHIWLALTTDRENRNARPVAYGMKQTKQPESALIAPPYATMFVTGLVVLLFLIVHLADMPLADVLGLFGVWQHGGSTPFEHTLNVLHNPLSALVYIVGSLFLGYHVLHGFQSAFQTLGINHPKYMSLIVLLSRAFAVIVALGFASFVVWAWVAKT